MATVTSSKNTPVYCNHYLIDKMHSLSSSETLSSIISSVVHACPARSGPILVAGKEPTGKSNECTPQLLRSSGFEVTRNQGRYLSTRVCDVRLSP